MGTLADHFRVIAPDTRGCGRTAHSGSEEVSFDLLADDVVALIDALGLERPLIAGFSEGAITATIVAIRHPEAIRAIVNHAGFDCFNPGAASFAMCRMMLGGSPDATKADPDAAAGFFAQSDEMRAMFELMKRRPGQRTGTRPLEDIPRLAFPRISKSPGYTYEDLRKISGPTLILAGDRDNFCSVEEGVTAYRMLQHGELAILPDTGTDHPGRNRDDDRVLRATARRPVRPDARGRLKRKACRSCRRSTSCFMARSLPSASCKPHTTSPRGEPRSGPPCPSGASTFTTSAKPGPTSPKAPGRPDSQLGALPLRLATTWSRCSARDRL